MYIIQNPITKVVVGVFHSYDRALENFIIAYSYGDFPKKTIAELKAEFPKWVIEKPIDIMKL